MVLSTSIDLISERNRPIDRFRFLSELLNSKNLFYFPFHHLKDARTLEMCFALLSKSGETFKMYSHYQRVAKTLEMSSAFSTGG